MMDILLHITWNVKFSASSNKAFLAVQGDKYNIHLDLNKNPKTLESKLFEKETSLVF